jgi:hypothetical protein
MKASPAPTVSTTAGWPVNCRASGAVGGGAVFAVGEHDERRAEIEPAGGDVVERATRIQVADVFLAGLHDVGGEYVAFDQ